VSEEIEGQNTGAEAVAGGADPAAMALALSGASREKADAYLDDQRRMLRLQMEELTEEHPLKLSRLRWQRFGDQMKGALQIMAVLLGAAIVIGLLVAMWNASQASGLVVEAFTVPPQLAATGLTGDIVADDLTDKIIAIRSIADAQSVGRSEDVKKDSGEDIKVEIPETGISVAQAWRYLRAWLGHERHLRGNLRITGDGNVILALNGDDAAKFSGPLNALGRLEQQAAEYAYASVNSDNTANYVVYLQVVGRAREADAVTAHYAQSATEYRADWYALWAQTTRYVGNMPLSLSRAALAEAMAPGMATPHMEMMFNADLLGHENEVLRQAQAIAKLKDTDQPIYERGTGFENMREMAASFQALATGDFTDLQSCAGSRSRALQLVYQADCTALAHDPIHGRALTDAALATGTLTADALHLARYDIAAMAGDWPHAISEARAYQTALAAIDPTGSVFRTRAEPRIAIALAQTGDFGAAHKAINATPTDCYLCLRMRGRIDAAEKNYGGGVFWFTSAVRAAPSIPFAYTDWGHALLERGQPDAAIEKFKLANQKGPHFADPLEMWGEALMAKNQSHLALTKFAEADKYAPNWGRLHLKWGEALVYAGKRDEAQAQFARAAQLDLSAAEKYELAQEKT
jgi:tetratricopeptide (TPR) repeat protein